jgi:hypothetical protein
VNKLKVISAIATTLGLSALSTAQNSPVDASALMPLIPGAKYTYSAGGLIASEWNGVVSAPDAVTKEIAFTRTDTAVIPNAPANRLDYRSWFFVKDAAGLKYAGRYSAFKDGFIRDIDLSVSSLWLKTGIVPGTAADNGFGGVSLQNPASWTSQVSYTNTASSAAPLSRVGVSDAYSEVVIENVTTLA